MARVHCTSTFHAVKCHLHSYTGIFPHRWLVFSISQVLVCIKDAILTIARDVMLPWSLSTRRSLRRSLELLFSESSRVVLVPNIRSKACILAWVVVESSFGDILPLWLPSLRWLRFYTGSITRSFVIRSSRTTLLGICGGTSAGPRRLITSR